MQRCFLILVFALSACVTLEAADKSKLENDLTFINDDMALAEGLSSMSLQGFACKEGTNRVPPQPGAFECTRKKGPSWAPQMCVQTVTFQAVKNRVANLKALAPVCDSKYGI